MAVGPKQAQGKAGQRFDMAELEARVLRVEMEAREAEARLRIVEAKARLEQLRSEGLIPAAR